MTMKKLSALFLACAAVIVGAVAIASSEAQARGSVDGPVVYVISQGRYYDSIVQTMLPQEGPFQQLFPIVDEMGEVIGLETEFGPGDVEFVGGRWWIDINGDTEMDGGDLYFSCPLLGPGRTTP